MSLRPETIDIQEELGAYCRDGELRDLPGARSERLPEYRRLVFNVIKGVLKQAFPISRKVLPKETWDQLVFDFWKEHKCQEAEVWRMPREVVEYVEQSGYAEKLERPWLTELLYFEWLEIEVHGMPDEDIPETHPLNEEDPVWKEAPLVVNPYHRLVHFRYPVHKASAETYEAQQGNHYVLLYRDLQEMAVHFMDLSGFSAIFLEFLKTESATFQRALQQTLTTFNRETSPEVEQAAEAFFRKLVEREVILGTTASPAI